MRLFHRVAQIGHKVNSTTRFQHQGVSRDVALARWNARPVADAKKEATSMVGTGMKFASSAVSGSWKASRSSVASTIADVSWDLCERLEFYVQYSVPSNWLVAERVNENSIAVQCRPPCTGTGEEVPTVHGFSLNCFAYKERVKNPDSERLLNLFLQRFNASVSNSLEVISRSSGSNGNARHNDSSDKSISESLASRLDCAVAEITFTPVVGEPLAHGLCRAFYNSNCRFHYVVVVAVPENEFEVSKDLLTHALLAVVESRVEAAAKRT